MSNIKVGTKDRLAILETRLDLFEKDTIANQEKETLGLKKRITELEQSIKSRRSDSSGTPSEVPTQKYLFERKILITLVSCSTPILWQEFLNLPSVANVAAGICIFAAIDQLTEPLHEPFALFIDGLKDLLRSVSKQGFTYMQSFCTALLGFLKKAIGHIIALSDDIVRFSYAILMLITNRVVTIPVVLALLAHYIGPEFFGTTNMLNKVAEFITRYEVDAKMRESAENLYVQGTLLIFIALLGIGMTHIVTNGIVNHFSSTKSHTTS